MLSITLAWLVGRFEMASTSPLIRALTRAVSSWNSMIVRSSTHGLPSQ